MRPAHSLSPLARGPASEINPLQMKNLRKKVSKKFNAPKQSKSAQIEKDPMELELVYNRKHLS